MISQLRTDLKELLHLFMTNENASKGTIQKFDSEKNVLLVVESEGFSKVFLDHFKTVSAFDSSCCGRAFGVGSTIVISDVELDLAFRPNLPIARTEGYRSVKSTPVYDTAGKKVGVVSIHFTEPKWNWDMHLSESLLPKVAQALKVI